MELHQIVRSIQIKAGYATTNEDFVEQAADLTTPAPSVAKILDIIQREHRKMLGAHHWSFARKIAHLDTIGDDFIGIPLRDPPQTYDGVDYTTPLTSVDAYNASPVSTIRLASNEDQSVLYVLGLSRPGAWSTAHVMDYTLGTDTPVLIGGVNYVANTLTLNSPTLPFQPTYVVVIGRDPTTAMPPIGYFASEYRDHKTFALLPDDLLNIISLDPNQEFQIVGSRLLLPFSGDIRVEYTAHIEPEHIPDALGGLYLEALIARATASAIPVLSQGAAPATAVQDASEAWRVAVNRNAQNRSSDYNRHTPLRTSRHSYGARGFYR